ncbi:MAG: aminoacyl-histidine dipeptidase [Epsilonproteobacteria bacterium]|nr:aminoacyl-histidine dipeptidase [Campylobacterota bacterium]
MSVIIICRFKVGMEGKLILKDIEPKGLWKQFVSISAIPRCSRHEAAIGDYVRSEAARHKLESAADEYGNITVKIPAANSSSERIILQSHLDMVCESAKPFDFANRPIKLIYEDGKVHSEGTTLGADNGIGVASMLSLMDEQFSHPPILLLFTADEETGLNGAKKLSEKFITGKRLLNLDGEEFGKIYTGSAGGIVTIGTAKIDKIQIPEKGYKIFVGGLKGGHSGVDIDNSRTNAIKLLFEILEILDEKYEIKIASIEAGDKINAIPRSAEAVILTSDSTVKQVIVNKINDLKQTSDENIKLNIEKTDAKDYYRRTFSRKLIRMINAIPNGVLERSKGRVYTSSNLASIKEGKKLTIKTFQRSYNNIDMNTFSSKIATVFRDSGFSAAKEGEFPGWEPTESELLRTAEDQFEKLFGKKAETLAIHAGIECGIIKNQCSIEQLISFGPTIKNAHSPAESVEVESVEKFYRFLKKLIEAL